jgi:transposase
MDRPSELHEHYEKLLGISDPWRVDRVDLDVRAARVDLYVIYRTDAPVQCPVCGVQCPRRDHSPPRSWRHLDTMQFQTILHASVPRAHCKEHGVHTIKTSWSERYSRFTMLFERFAIDVILACENIADAARLLRLSWDEMSLIQSKAVTRGLQRRTFRKIRYLGIDEKSFQKKRRFVTVLNDLERRTVLDVAPSKTQEAAETLIRKLPARTRHSIKAISMDLAIVYRMAAAATLPKAAIVFDKFHISKFLNEAVEQTWRRENRARRKNNDDSLSKTRFLWLSNPASLTPEQSKEFANLRKTLSCVGRAWQLREAFKQFWRYSYKGSAKNFFKRWYFWATHSRLPSMIYVARRLKKHLNQLLNYINHPLTNAASEGINSRIQSIRARGRGFRSFDNFRATILFHLGGLELYP